MKRIKKIVVEGIIQERAVYHIPTGQFGYCLPGTALGDLFFFAEHDQTEVLSDRFCNFLDDQRDPKSFSAKDFLDLGPL